MEADPHQSKTIFVSIQSAIICTGLIGGHATGRGKPHPKSAQPPSHGRAAVGSPSVRRRRGGADRIRPTDGPKYDTRRRNLQPAGATGARAETETRTGSSLRRTTSTKRKNRGAPWSHEPAARAEIQRKWASGGRQRSNRKWKYGGDTLVRLLDHHFLFTPIHYGLYVAPLRSYSCENANVTPL